MRVFVAGIEGESGFGECNRSVHQQPLSLSLMCASTRSLLGISQLVSFNISFNLRLLLEARRQPVDASHPPLQKCAFLTFSAEPKQLQPQMQSIIILVQSTGCCQISKSGRHGRCGDGGLQDITHIPNCPPRPTTPSTIVAS